MKQPSELDIAQLRHEMRELYRNVGFEGALQLWLEMLWGANILGEVIIEETIGNGN